MRRTYRIHVAAELTGLSEERLRAWERRYGVPKPRRTSAGYRSYTPLDIEVLRGLKRLTQEGVAISAAVKLLPQLRRAHREPGAQGAAAVSRWRDEALTATQRLDQDALEALFTRAAAALTPDALVDELVMPLMREVGERWHSGTATVAEEHLLTQAVRQAVLGRFGALPRHASRHVLCACFPDEEHELGLLGAALRYRALGWRVTLLGPRTPLEHLARAARRLRPDEVALSSVVDVGAARFEATVREALQGLAPPATLVLGGAGARAHLEVAQRLGVRVDRFPTP